MDGDGTIAFPDFLIFVNNFGKRPPDRTFNIDLIFVRPNAFTPHEKGILSRAVERWEEIITEDVPDVDYSKNPIDEWDEDLQGRIVVQDRVDDLRIFVNERPIVNAGGKGGPRHMRYRSGIPAIGVIIFDKTAFTSDWGIYNLASHEIGPVLGIGALWQSDYWQPYYLQRKDNAYFFPGPLAIEAFDAIGGTRYTGAKVPVDDDRAHWHKTIYHTEIMSGTRPPYGEPRPISLVTIQTLADFGYGVDVSRAEPYRVRATKPSVTQQSIWECRILHSQITIVDREGKVVQTILKETSP